MATTNKEFHAKNGIRVGSGTGTVAIDASGAWTGSSIGIAKLTLGTLGVNTGGTGATSFTAGYMKSPGSTGALTTVVSIPGSDITGNITGNAGGLTATLVPSSGGTGFSSYTAGEMLFASNANTLSKISPNSTATLKLLSQTSSGTPSWYQITKSDVGLNLVENTALSTWAGTANITTVGNVTSGTWNGTTISVTRGGTGATTTTGALDSLLPGGRSSGYVLKTGGSGSYYWAAETGGASIIGTKITSTFTLYSVGTNGVLAGDTAFATGGTYVIGTNQVRVHLNGVKLIITQDYTESSTTGITLVNGLAAGDVLTVETDGYISYNYTADAVTSTAVGSVGATTVQGAINELEAEKQPNITITDDTTTNATMYPMFVTGTSSSTSRKLATTKLTFNPSTGTLAATTVNSLSDLRLKENVQKIKYGVDVINNLNAVSFDWKDSGKKSYGVIAQEIEAVLPELVEQSGGNKTVNYSGLISFLIKAVQELDQRVNELER